MLLRLTYLLIFCRYPDLLPWMGSSVRRSMAVIHNLWFWLLAGSFRSQQVRFNKYRIPNLLKCERIVFGLANSIQTANSAVKNIIFLIRYQLFYKCGVVSG